MPINWIKKTLQNKCRTETEHIPQPKNYSFNLKKPVWILPWCLLLYHSCFLFWRVCGDIRFFSKAVVHWKVLRQKSFQVLIKEWYSITKYRIWFCQLYPTFNLRNFDIVWLLGVCFKWGKSSHRIFLQQWQIHRCGLSLSLSPALPILIWK